ncbi:MAG: hypothetical protein IJP63_05565 [Acholeplasmatales bacterium]|nr:hypothetical protein [Acholeplasmatales bacterium]
MLDKKTKIIFMAVVAVMAAISVTVGAFLLYFVFSGSDVPYFFNHFGLAIVLACIGVIAFILPFFGQKKYADDTRDSIMLIVAGLLVLAGLLSIIMSYLGVGFYA